MMRSCLAEQLDLLTFSTHAGFEIIGPKRLIDWGAGQKERRIWVYCIVDEVTCRTRPWMKSSSDRR